MKIKRREFSASLVGAGVGAAVLAPALPVRAQAGAPVEGTNYVRLSQAVPTSSGNKIEVIEFFWYGCPHCNALEPALEPWAKQLPADVSFRRVPVAFREEPFSAHQRLFFALEAMGQVNALQPKVFYAIHGEHQKLDKPDDAAAFVAKFGVDKAKFLENYNSFSTQTKMRQANQLAAAYKIDGVPTLGVQGRYFTSGSLAGSNERMLSVVDFLVQKIRKGG